MKIEFDAGNETELSAVFVAIAVLRGGDMSLPLLVGDDVEVPTPPAPAPAPIAEVPAPPAPVPAPPLAPAPAAPVVPAPAAPATGEVDVDKAGLPYDARIHSNPPSKKKDGYWRQKRGVSDELVASVTAELQQAMAAPGAAVEVPALPLPPAPEPVADAATVFGADAAASASSPLDAATADGWLAHPESEGFYYRGQEVVATADLLTRYAAPAPVPAPPAAPAAPAPVGAQTPFGDLMRKVTSLQSSGHLTVEGTLAIAQSLGITGVRDLMHRPDLIPAFDAALPVVA